jgi:hypothetical protein
MPATANATEPAVARTRPQPGCALAQPPKQSNGWWSSKAEVYAG